MKNILADIKWVFIDIGSTLINQDDAVENRILQIQGVLEDSGISVPRAEIRAILQEAATEQALSPISRAIAKLTDSEELRGRLKAEVKWRKDLEKPYPEATCVLSALSERYRNRYHRQSISWDWGQIGKVGLLEVHLSLSPLGRNRPKQTRFGHLRIGD